MSHQKILATRIQSLGEDISQFAQELKDDTKNFAILFPNLPMDQIEIVIRLPSPFGECRLIPATYVLRR